MLLTSTHPLVLFSREFRELCKPLALLHVEHFTYQKQFNDGTRISLCNKPQWVKDYYNLKLYESSLFEKKPSAYKAGFQVWTDEYDIEVYRYGRKFYNTANSITISEPDHDGCEHYLFSATPEKSQAIHYLANNMNLLYHFILHLKDKGATIFKSAQKHRIKVQESFIASEFGNVTYPHHFHEEMEKAKSLFLNETPISSYIIPSANMANIKITKQEMSCINYLLQDKTAKETAKLLNISPRTVETYLDNIKTKLQCETKIELVRKLTRNKYLSTFKE